MQTQSYFNPNIVAYYLTKTHNRMRSEHKARILFLVENDFVWDKQSLIYDVLVADEDVEPIIVLLPSYSGMDHAMGRTVGGYEEHYWHFFHDRYMDVYDFTNVMDLRIIQPDYIFLALPYEALRPLSGTLMHELVQIAKLCYVDYGVPGTKFFLHEWKKFPFFSYLSFYFCDSAEEKIAMEATHPYTVATGLQHFEDLGYPAYEPYLKYRREQHTVRRVLWTPRWTTDPVVGGSHFLEYKDLFVDFAKKYRSDQLEFVIRPHPFMFDNFIQRGYMTESEVAMYKEKLNACGIILDDGACTPFEALSRADILLTDFSSLNMPFFLLERPMIYCPNGTEPTEDYKEMLRASYAAEDWAQVESLLELLIRGEDPAADLRRTIVAAFREKHLGAAKRIVDRLKADYADCLHPQQVYLPDVEKWIFDRKRELVSVIASGNKELLQNFCAQEWYALYLTLMPLRSHDENLVWGEEQILGKLLEMYEAAEEHGSRSCLVLAMLLFADPLTLPVPVEIELWHENLYLDIQEIFRQYRMERGVT